MTHSYTSRRRRKYLWLLVVLLLSTTKAYSLFVDEKVPPGEPEDRVYLIHADNLRYDDMLYPGAQRLSGKVQFRHGGMYLYCDSAVLYNLSNSFEAMGRVRMTQGDTLTLTGDSLYYDGNTQIAEVRRNVRLTHRNQVLKSDSLNYDRLYNKGYYFEGGELIDGENHLYSDWGEYYTDTRLADFYYRVSLVNPKFTLTTDTLHYDTRTKWSHILGPSNIVTDDSSRVYTENAYYNSDTEQVRLYDRSQLFNKQRKMVGDSLYYNRDTGVMEAFKDIVFEDAENKNIMLGDYCWYNEQTGEALAYGRALIKDYSNVADTLFVHADTLRMYSYNLQTDSACRVMHGYFHVRAYRSDVQAVCDSLVANSLLKRMDLYRDPIVWSDNRQILGEEINVFSNDSTLDSVYVQRQALMVEQIDSTHYNQVAGQLMRSYFNEKKEIRENRVDGNVYVVFYPLEKDSTLLYQNYTETSQLRMFMENRKMKRLWTPAAQGELFPIGMAPPEKTLLSNFAWFDYVRPRDKYDLFEWRGKKKGTALKASIRREAPLQKLEEGGNTHE